MLSRCQDVSPTLRELGFDRPAESLFAEHHVSHAAAAFYPSPFESACVLTFDGVGEWATSSIGRGLGRRVDRYISPHLVRFNERILIDGAPIATRTAAAPAAGAAR